MANPYYNASGEPTNAAGALSLPLRAEYNAIEAGCSLLPQVSSSANQLIAVNPTANALESLPPASAVPAIGAVLASMKDFADGYLGLTAWKVNFTNAIGTIKSFLVNSNSAIRTYTFQDKSGYMLLRENASTIYNRNILINGSFLVWQRGISHTAAGYKTNDRWYDNHGDGTVTTSRQTFTPGQTDVPGNPKYFARAVVVTSGTAGSFACKEQWVWHVGIIENRSATLSFYAKADAPKDMAIEFVQNFGLGGSDEVAGIGVQKVSLTTNWQLFTLHVSLPSIATKTVFSPDDDALVVRFWFEAGSTYNGNTLSLGNQSGTFDLSNVQLERGGARSQFERRSYARELYLCQPYFQIVALRYSGKVTNTKAYKAIGVLQRAMRTYNPFRSTWPGGVYDGFPSTGTASTPGVSYNAKFILETRTCNSTKASGYFASYYSLDSEI